MSSSQSPSAQKRARFRFKAEIYDTDKNNSNITFYVINVKIYGLNVDEYEIKKRFSEFAEFDNRLKARFHHKRLPQLPSKTITKSAKHADEFISKRKTALNRYLRGVGQRLYLQNCEAIWNFFEFINKINPYLHRYRVLHLKSIQCNDYQIPNDDSKETQPKESTGFSFRNLFAKVTTPTNKLSSATSKANKKVLREWRVIYGAFIESNIYLSVSTIHSDNTKNNWWDTFMSTATDAKALLSNNTFTNDDENDMDMDKDEIEQPIIENIPNSEKETLEDSNSYNREDRLESVDFDTKSDLNTENTKPLNQSKKGLSAWEAEKLAFAQNEFYLGKIEIYKWNESTDNNEETEIMYKSFCRFPLVRNRPSSALFIAEDNLLLVGTSHGKILCFKLNRKTSTLSHICYLPRVFGSYVTDIIALPCDKIYYQQSAYVIRNENPLPRGTDKTKEIGQSFVYAVSNDCHLGVFDLRTGDCLGHIQTGITGNLSVTYCCEKLFVSTKSNNNIAVFIRSSKSGDPVPMPELIGHTTTVYALHSDENNKRLFSGSGDNSVAVWYYDKLQDTMLQIQQLKSVNKSSKFTCITTAKNINCLVAGGDNGFITLWHEYDSNCDELSDKMYDLRMVIAKRKKGERECKENNASVKSTKAIDVSDNVPPSLRQQNEILKRDSSRDISKNNLQNGSISSRKSKSNMVWKCVYTWKAHKGSVTTVTYFEEYNMLMSTSNSGQIRLVYLCDPGTVPPMTMVSGGKDKQWCEFIRDKLNKIFNEIQEIESNNYESTEYQDLNLLNEYEGGNEESNGNINASASVIKEETETETDNKVEEEPETEKEKQEYFQSENKEVDAMWSDDKSEVVKESVTDDFDNIVEDTNENETDDFDTVIEDENEKNIDINNEEKESEQLIEEEVPAHENTSLADLL